MYSDILQSLRHFPRKMPPPFTQGRLLKQTTANSSSALRRESKIEFLQSLTASRSSRFGSVTKRLWRYQRHSLPFCRFTTLYTKEPYAKFLYEWLPPGGSCREQARLRENALTVLLGFYPKLKYPRFWFCVLHPDIRLWRRYPRPASGEQAPRPTGGV